MVAKHLETLLKLL